MPFNYQKFIRHLISKGKRREAGFIQKFYLEHKSRSEIIEEMYMNSAAYYYSVKKRAKKLIEQNYGMHQFLDKK